MAQRNALSEAASYLSRLKDQAGGIAGNIANYFNPSAGIKSQSYVSPVQKYQAPTQVRSFWTDIPQVPQPKMSLGQAVRNTFSTPNWFYPVAVAQGQAALPKFLDPVTKPVGQFGTGFIEGGTSAGLINAGAKPQNAVEQVAREAGKYTGMFMPYSIPARLMGGPKPLLKESVIGAPVNVALQGVMNKVQGKPFLKNAPYSAKEGFDISAQLGPMGKVTGSVFGPMFNKIYNPAAFETLMVGGKKLTTPLFYQGAENALRSLTRTGLEAAIPYATIEGWKAPEGKKAQAIGMAFAQAFLISAGIKLTTGSVSSANKFFNDHMYAIRHLDKGVPPVEAAKMTVRYLQNQTTGKLNGSVKMKELKEFIKSPESKQGFIKPDEFLPAPKGTKKPLPSTNPLNPSATTGALGQGQSVFPLEQGKQLPGAQPSVPQSPKGVGGGGISRGVQEGMDAWKNGKLYWDGNNYRMGETLPGGSSRRGQIAPFNKELKAAFPTPDKLHEAISTPPPLNQGGIKMYHGTSKDWQGQFKEPVKGQYGSEAIFLAPTKEGAKYYNRADKGGAIKEVLVDPNAKIWDFQNKKDLQVVKDFVDKQGLEKIDPTWIAGKEAWLKKVEQGDYSLIQKPAIMDLLRKNGFDGFKQVDWYDYGKDISTGVFSPSKVKVVPTAPLNQGAKVGKLPQEVTTNTKSEPLPWEASAYIKRQKPEGLPIKTDVASQQQAEASTVLGNEGKGGIGGLTSGPRKAFQDWVNTQRARFVEGTLKGREFADLDNKGMDGIFEFQSGNKTGRFADVKKYFDAKRDEVIKSGIDINYKKDYLPQLWANSPEEVQKVFGTTLSKRPSFSMESVIKDYKTGIDAGLTPKFQNISQLVSWYESHANKAIADANFFKYLAKEGLIQPGNKAPFSGWETLSPDRFPKLKVNTGEGSYVGNYKAPKEMATLINNYLNAPAHETLAKIADFASTSKNRMLSFGIPGTAINAHGFNILFRNTVSSLSHGDIGGVVNGFKYMLNPGSAGKYVEKEMTKAPFAIKHGLTLSSSEYQSLLDEAPTTVRGKFGQTWNTAFEKGLFDQMIPALKLQNFYKVYEGYKRSGMKDYEAAKAAATFTNDVFGGINWAELGRSKDTQNLMRSIILAPDWLETNVRLAKKIPQSVTTGLTDPAMKAYRQFTAAFLATYAGLNVVNKISSGHWMYENDPGHAFEIEMGQTPDGQKRYIRPMGTGADFIRLPIDVAIGLQKGDFSVVNRIIRNRLSTIAGSAYSIATDTDYAGNPIGIKGTDRWGRPMSPKERIAGVAGQVGNIAGFPSFLQRGLGYATGQEGGEQALAQGLEMPVRYSGNRMRPASVENNTLSYTVKENGKIKTKTMSLAQPLPGFETKYGVNSTAAKILQESQFMNPESSMTKQQAADLLKKLGADPKIAAALAKKSVQTKQIETLRTAYKIRTEYYKMPEANRANYLQQLKDKGVLTPEVVQAIKAGK